LDLFSVKTNFSKKLNNKLLYDFDEIKLFKLCLSTLLEKIDKFESNKDSLKNFDLFKTVNLKKLSKYWLLFKLLLKVK
jgi:hypothetical protein